MKTTTNYGLKKPEAADFYNVEDANSNMDVIDEKLKELESNGSDAADAIKAHVENGGTNPHGTTKSDVGLSNVPNVATNNQTPTYTVPNSWSELTSGEKLSAAFGKIAKFIKDGIAKFTSIENDLETKVSKSGGILTGDLRIRKDTYTDIARMIVNSKEREIGLLAENDPAVGGVYDYTSNKYLVRSDKNGNVYVDDKMQKLQTMTELAHIGCGTDNTITEIMTALPKYTEMITGTGAVGSNLNNSLGIGGAAGILICRKFGANRGEVIWRRTVSPATIYTWGWHEGTLSKCEQIALRSDLASYLPLTGGTASGDIKVQQSDNNANVVVKSPTREIALCAQNSANGNKVGLWDGTVGNWIISSDKDGFVTVNGVSSGLQTVSNSANRLITQAYKGNKSTNDGRMYVQADYNNKNVIVGILGLGEVGVNKAYFANVANQLGDASTVDCVSLRGHTGTPTKGTTMFLQADHDHQYVNVGINGLGTTGVNKAYAATRAYADDNGNVIHDTYSTKSSVDALENLVMSLQAQVRDLERRIVELEH